MEPDQQTRTQVLERATEVEMQLDDLTSDKKADSHRSANESGGHNRPQTHVKGSVSKATRTSKSCGIFHGTSHKQSAGILKRMFPGIARLWNADNTATKTYTEKRRKIRIARKRNRENYSWVRVLKQPNTSDQSTTEHDCVSNDKVQRLLHEKELQWKTKEENFLVHIKQLHDSHERITKKLQTQWEESEFKIVTIQEQHAESTAEEKRIRDNTEETLHSRIADLNNNVRSFNKAFAKSESDRKQLQLDLDTFIRKHQDATFKTVKPGRWTPADEKSTMDQLEALKRKLRAWAKETADPNNSALGSLDKDVFAGLREQLAEVTHLVDGRLPEGLSKLSRGSSLLLNALLSHHLYLSFFASPFFFCAGYGQNDNNGTYCKEIPELQPYLTQDTLETIYRQGKEINEAEAHKWRAQTLKMRMPPTRSNPTEAEEALRNLTKEAIARSAEQQCNEFLASPAAHLFASSATPNRDTKLLKIYTTFATLATTLSTRRTSMKCLTLHSHELKDLTFDADSPLFEPDMLVHLDGHGDRFKGRKLLLMVHPILMVCGTDEGKGYDDGETERVWARGVVWVDSRDEKGKI